MSKHPPKSAGPPEPGITTRCVVARVIDGDTVEVSITKILTVRLLDCWAPETRTTDLEEKARGLAAKAHLEDLAEGRFALLHVPADESGRVGDVFTMGRVLGDLWISPGTRFIPRELVNVAEEMVAHGFATKTKQPEDPE